MRSRQPVRVFYNATPTSVGGPGLGALVLGGMFASLPPSDCMTIATSATWLHRGSVQEPTSVIIVVDGNPKINLGQLADYIAMIGLAQVRMQADTGTAPCILRLFQGSGPQPPGLTRWDEAFLQSLYTTDQSSVLEVEIIEDRMFQQLFGR